jgi:hypothetical protein
MEQNKEELSPLIKALQKTDLSPLIRMGDLMIPRMLDAFLPKMDAKQKAAFDKTMPVGGQKRIYINLIGNPTPPIVIQMAQPPRIFVMGEDEVIALGIRGIKLTVDDLQTLTERRIGKAIWNLKSQTGSLLSLSGMFIPFIRLGRAELIDLQKKLMTHFKPLIDLLPRSR